jgi:hypothetical protein
MKTNKITGANTDGRSQAMRLRWSVVLVASVLLPLVVGTPCFGKDGSMPVRARGKGRVTIVYQDDAILPENRDVIKKIRDSGVFERMADRLTKAGALPHVDQPLVNWSSERNSLSAVGRDLWSYGSVGTNEHESL